MFNFESPSLLTRNDFIPYSYNFPNEPTRDTICIKKDVVLPDKKCVKLSLAVVDLG